jgi:ParB family chromosome partitioning protein
VLAAVTEAVSPDTAQRLSDLKKADLVAAAEPDLVKARWLPALLRTRTLAPEPQDAETGPAAQTAAGLDDAAAPSAVEAIAVAAE